MYGWAGIGYWLAIGSNWLTPVEDLEEEVKRAIQFGKMICNDPVRFDGFASFYGLLRNLSERPWWTRVWVLQEYMFAASALFVYGKSNVEGGLFDLAIMLAWEMDVYLEKRRISESLKAYMRAAVLVFDHNLLVAMSLQL
jgi:hypothetical protein